MVSGANGEEDYLMRMICSILDRPLGEVALLRAGSHLGTWGDAYRTWFASAILPQQFGYYPEFVDKF